MIKKAIVTGTWRKTWLAKDVIEVLDSIQELKNMYPHLNLSNAQVEFVELGHYIKDGDKYVRSFRYAYIYI